MAFILNKTFFFFIFTIILVLLIPQRTAAQTATAQGLEFFRQMEEDDYHQVQPLIYNAMTIDEKKIAASVGEPLMSLDNSIRSPYAKIDEVTHKRIINFPVGFYRYILGLGDIVIIQQGMKRGSISDYMNYALEVMKDNAAKPDFQKRKILWPSEYYHVSKQTMIKLTNDPELGLTRTGLIIGSVAFVYAHEMAHHVLGHTLTPPLNLAESRKRERDADEWATKTLLKAGIIPLGGIYALSVYYMADRDALLTESHRDHPAELRRFELVTDLVIKSLPLFKDRMEAQNMNYDKAFAKLQASFKAILEEIRKVDAMK